MYEMFSSSGTIYVYLDIKINKVNRLTDNLTGIEKIDIGAIDVILT